MKGSKARPENLLHRPSEVAKMLRCSEWWVKEQARRRRIPFSWIGGSHLFTDEHVTEIIRIFESPPPNHDPSQSASGGSARGLSRKTSEPKVRLKARPPRRTVRQEAPPEAA